MHRLAAILILFAACGDDQQPINEKQHARSCTYLPSGTYLLRYATISGDCPDLQDEVLQIQPGQFYGEGGQYIDPACTTTSEESSLEECSYYEARECLADNGATHVISAKWYFQEYAPQARVDKFEWTVYQAGQLICHGAYRVTAELQ